MPHQQGEGQHIHILPLEVVTWEDTAAHEVVEDGARSILDMPVAAVADMQDSRI